MRIRPLAHFFFLAVLSALILRHFVFSAFTDSSPTSSGPPGLHKSVWALYVGFWGNPPIDDQWRGWRFPRRGRSQPFYEPPFDIPSSLYPQLGLYSSRDASVLRRHCAQMDSSGIDAVIFQWWGSENREIPQLSTNSELIDQSLRTMLSVAGEFDLKVGIEIKAYPSRSAESVCRDMAYIRANYWNRSSLLKIDGKPVVFVYDPHTVDRMDAAVEWIGKHCPAFLVATVVDRSHVYDALENGFSGFSSYFASDNSNWVTNISNWPFVRKDAEERDLLFIPAVAPGYSDQKMTNWEHHNERARANGAYYEKMWSAAIYADPIVVLINSFNHWSEGTGIEPSLNMTPFAWTAHNWVAAGTPTSFLELTKSWTDRFKTYVPSPPTPTPEDE